MVFIDGNPKADIFGTEKNKMRNADLYQLLKDAGFEKPFQHLVNGNGVQLNELRRKIKLIEKIPGFEAEVDILKNSLIYKTGADSVQPIASDEWNKIGPAFSLIWTQLGGIFRYLKPLVSRESPESVFIKLPDYVGLTEFEGFFNRLEKILSQAVINDEIKGKVEVRGWEQGSFWLEIYVGSGAAVSIIAAITKAAYNYNVQLRENAIFEKRLQALSTRNEMTAELQRLQSRLIQKYLDNDAVAIEEASFPDKIPEREERLKFAIKEMGKLILEGTEIHPSLTAPKELQQKFPDPLLELKQGEIMKLLSQGNLP